MNSQQMFSHCKLYQKRKKRQPKQQSFNDDDEAHSRRRSVTYNNDAELIKQINSSENLLDLIGKIQKKKQDLSTQVSEEPFLPPLQIEQENHKYRSRPRYTERSPKEYEEQPTIQELRKKRYFEQFNLMGKFIEPTVYKKIDYKSTRTLESAIALHTDMEPKVYKTERKEVKPIKIEPEKEEPWKKTNMKFHSLSITEDEHVVNLYNKQAKMNKIINRALSIKSQARDPSNASKSVLSDKVKFQMDLRKQYENALEKAMSGEQVYFEKFIRKKTYSKSNSARTKVLTNQQQIFLNKPIKIHPKKQLLVCKTIDIQNLCSTYVNE